MCVNPAVAQFGNYVDCADEHVLHGAGRDHFLLPQAIREITSHSGIP